MKIRIAGVEIDKWQNLSVTRIFDSVKSIFSFDLYFDPFDKKSREIMLPGAYIQCTIVADDGELLLTGVMHSPSFEDSPTPCLVNISGCSITGVLDDCKWKAIFPDNSQLTNMTYLQICQMVCARFGFGMVDKTDGAAAATTLTLTDAGDSETCTGYLSAIAKDSKITLSHDASGNLILSTAKDTVPVFDFVSGMPGVKINLSFDGQMMHSTITGAAQGGSTQKEVVSNPYAPSKGAFNYRVAAINTGNVFNSPAGQLNILNEFSTGYRPTYLIQTDSEDSLKSFVENALMEELKAITVTVKMNGWTLNNKIVGPEQIITILSPRCYLFNKTKFFIQSVTYTGDEKEGGALLNCVVPEAFNGKTPINIFTYQGNNTNFNDVEGGIILKSQDRGGPKL